MFDLSTAASPIEACRMLRLAAQEYRETASELQSAWQDPKAGAVWLALADGMDKIADKAELEWNKL